MNKISFDGIGQEVATFEAASGVTAGHVVKMADNGKVSKCMSSICNPSDFGSKSFNMFFFNI